MASFQVLQPAGDFLVSPCQRLAHDESRFVAAHSGCGVEDVGEPDAAVEEEEAATAVSDLPPTIGIAGEKIEGKLAVAAGRRLTGTKTWLLPSDGDS